MDCKELPCRGIVAVAMFFSIEIFSNGKLLSVDKIALALLEKIPLYVSIRRLARSFYRTKTLLFLDRTATLLAIVLIAGLTFNSSFEISTKLPAAVF